MDFVRFKKRILSSVSYNVIFISSDTDIFTNVYVSVLNDTSLPTVIVIGNTLDIDTIFNLLPSDAISINKTYQLMIDTIINTLESTNIQIDLINPLNIIPNIALDGSHSIESIVNEILNMSINIFNVTTNRIIPRAINHNLNVSANVFAKNYNMIVSSISEELRLDINSIIGNSINIQSTVIDNTLLFNISMYIANIINLLIEIADSLNINVNANVSNGFNFQVALINNNNFEVKLIKETSLKIKTNIPILNTCMGGFNLKIYSLLSEQDNKLLSTIDNLLVQDLEYTII